MAHFVQRPRTRITTKARDGELVDPPPAVGSAIPIVYNPEDPQARVRDPRAPQGIRPVIVPLAVAAGAGVACLPVLFVQIKRRRGRRTRADEAGRAAEG